ncbi:unnamed protein product, partial [Amoebophrya sp. A25]
ETVISSKSETCDNEKHSGEGSDELQPAIDIAVVGEHNRKAKHVDVEEEEVEVKRIMDGAEGDGATDPATGTEHAERVHNLKDQDDQVPPAPHEGQKEDHEVEVIVDDEQEAS